MTARYDSPSAEWYEAPEPRFRTDEPTMDDLQEMVDEGIVMTTDGCYAEPDGYCEHNCPSWLLELGMI